ncbi:MAG: hypothetical protein HC867_04470 [Bacteroidia bacterium]|nr:hypothetical protein [Bacteroidia bacterium]
MARRFPEDSLLSDWKDSSRIIRTVTALRSEAHPAFLELNGKQMPLMHAQAGKRKYEGVAVPFVTRIAPDGFEVACLDGKTVFFSEIPLKEYNLQLNDRIKT